MPDRVGDLEIEQDLRFEKKDWAAQLIGRVVIGLLIVGALLGFFGAGPLSLTEVHDETGNLAVVYEHFGRRGATTDLTATIAPESFSNGQAKLWVSSDYLAKLQLDKVTPTPDQVSALDEGFTYTFLASEPDEELTVTFNFTIASMGPESGEIAVDPQQPIELNHFFTP